MRLNDITEKDIEDLADSYAILSRGNDYYRTGKILSMKIDNETIFARVRGNYGIYTIEINIDGDGEIDADCDCPYGGPGCKHVAAVLYKWINEHKQNKLLNIKQKSEKNQNIPIGNILSRTTPEYLIKAFELIDQVEIKQFDPEVLIAEVNDEKKEKVRIQHEKYGFRDAVSCQCSCTNNYGYMDQYCPHVIATALSKLPAKQKKSIAKEIDELKAKIRNEKYSAFVNTLDSAPAETETITQKLHFLFNVKQYENKLMMSVEKAPILKSGRFGKTSTAHNKHIEQDYEEMSETKKRAINLFLYTLKNNHTYWTHSHNNELIKDSFDNSIDFELLKNLQHLYQEDPTSFLNCSFPAEEARIEIETNKKNDCYAIGLKIKINEKHFELSKKSLLGQNWICIEDKKNHYLFIETKNDSPKLLKSIAEHTGIEINEQQLQWLIEKHYATLSRIGEMNLPEHYEIEEKIIEPKPRIFLLDYDAAFRVELRFLYGNKEVKYENQQNPVLKEGQKIIKIKRDLNKEKEFYLDLLNSQLTEKNGALVPNEPYAWLADITKELISRGYEIYGIDKLFNCKIRLEEPKLTIEVSSGIDWFDLKGEANLGEENIPFEQVMNAISNHERFIKLSDGTIGVIPKKWLNKLSGVMGLFEYDKQKRTAKASKCHISAIEALLEISAKSKTDEEFKKIKEKFKHFKEINDAPLPKQLNGKLRDYQKAGYNWLHFLKEFSFGGCLADDMGLGKTIQMLSLLLYEKEAGNKMPSLIVVPTSLVFNWLNEINKFTPSLKAYVHHGQKRIKDNFLGDNCDLAITTYGTLRQDIEFFSKSKFHYIILDESQQIKNSTSKVTRAVFNLQSKYKIALTGTPLENNSLELWSQFAFLNPGLLGNLDYFRTTFAKSIEKDKDKDKTSALKNLINPFLLSRKKETVAKELPEKQVTITYCEMEEAQAKIYSYWKSKLRQEIKETIETEGFMQARFKILQGLIKLRQISNHPVLVDESYTGESGKFNLLINQINEVLEEGHKVLIFSSFVKMLHIFSDYFNKNKIPFSYLDGSTKNRKEAVEEFQQNENIKIFLISLKAGGLGLNLTAADYVFIVDPWWNPAAEMQAIDRAHRIGQTKNVFVYKTITKDTVEEKILELQETKQELVKNIIGLEDGIFKKLTKEDINKIFA